MSESNILNLHRKKMSVDLGRAGLIATSLIDQFVSEGLGKLSSSMMQFGLAQAMLSELSNIEAALCIREISPYIDLLDGKGNRISHNQWFQDVPNFYDYDPLSRQRLSDEMFAIPVYNTNRDVNNDRKVYLIYGLEFLNDFRRRDVEFVEFWRRGTKLIMRFNIDRNQKLPLYKYQDIQDIAFPADDEEEGVKEFKISEFKNKHNIVYHNNMLIFGTPIMYKPNDIMEIRFRYRRDMNRAHDEIKLKGFVVEPLGLSTYS